MHTVCHTYKDFLENLIDHCSMMIYLVSSKGLTCTEQNFVTKAGAQRYAAEHGVAIVAPDTSPRESLYISDH